MLAASSITGSFGLKTRTVVFGEMPLQKEEAFALLDQFGRRTGKAHS